MSELTTFVRNTIIRCLDRGMPFSSVSESLAADGIRIKRLDDITDKNSLDIARHYGLNY